MRPPDFFFVQLIIHFVGMTNRLYLKVHHTRNILLYNTLKLYRTLQLRSVIHVQKALNHKLN